MKLPKMSSRGINVVLVALGVALGTGCATKSGYQQADKTGEAINTVRNDVAKVKIAVDNSMKALDGLAASATTDPRKPYETFSRSVDQLKDASDTAKRHADDMRERGKAYFEHWETEIASVKNEEIRKHARERHTELQRSFDTIKTAAEDTKQSFPPFMSDLQDLRTALGVDLTPAGIDSGKSIFLKTKNEGALVQKHLDKLVTELNSVYATITAAKVTTERAAN